MQPLDDILVLDFSTLLPGPMATLMLAEAGAEVIKFERPGTGEGARHANPKLNGESIGFAVLNHGKRSVAIDLKAEGAVESLRPLIENADVLVEQFRPGVMDRLGLGYDTLRRINPGLIYCSITGYGQTGPKAASAGHDLNYAGDSGVLSLSRGPDDHPTMPSGLIAD
ncbi:MAG: CaiB/BaiF CoA-transferase family protein, partial [Nitratireductor sp.]